MLLARHHYTIGQVICRHLQNAQKAVHLIGMGNPQTTFSPTPSPALLLLATPDQILPQIVEQLAHYSLSNFWILHFSGSLPSTLLQPLHACGAHIASMHPLKSFAIPNDSADSFPGTFCTYEGDAEFLPLLHQLLLDLKALPCPVLTEHKAIYHAAAVVASNYLVGLLQFALELFQKAGISEKDGLPALLLLMSGTLENIKKVGPRKALTGPIQRGDLSTIQLHLEHLLPEDRKLYQELGKKCLSLTPFSENQRKSIESLLE